MYAVQSQSHVELHLNQLVSVAQTMTPTFFFESNDASTLKIGLGAVSQIPVPASANAYEAVTDWYQELADRVPDQSNLSVFGGFPFETAPTTVTNQTAGYFFLPQLSLTRLSGGTFEIVSINTTPAAAQQQLDEFLKAVAQQPVAQMLTPKLATSTEIAPNQWEQGVAETINELKRDPSLKKVVLARRLEAVSQEKVRPEAVWLQTRDQNPETYHILLKTAVDVFVSATPERLLKVAGQTFETAAIAGTAARGTDSEADSQLAEALLTDVKNRQEQQYVTDEILAVLQKQDVMVTSDCQPRILKNRQVQHLYTPISGTLTGKTNAFDLLEQLHPTPALGGVPKKRALEVIERIETTPRGLFGAPIGYLDFQHNGEFVVGIRSAYLDDQTATLFAGAGIVADSVPEQELVETRLKFQPMLQTLFPKEGPHGEQ